MTAGVISLLLIFATTAVTAEHLSLGIGNALLLFLVFTVWSRARVKTVSTSQFTKKLFLQLAYKKMPGFVPDNSSVLVRQAMVIFVVASLMERDYHRRSRSRSFWTCTIVTGTGNERETLGVAAGAVVIVLSTT